MRLPSELHLYLSGVGLGASLIMAIGAQNIFVLKQGLRQSHVFLTALTCALCDAILIALGVMGLGHLVMRYPSLQTGITWAGVVFLSIYGLQALHSAYLGQSRLNVDNDTQTVSAGRIVISTLGFSLLNPHVYLDTVFLLGSIANTHSGMGRWWFGVGAMTASLLWFFGLAYGVRWLIPLFKRPAAWRVLDLAVAGIMLWIAYSLLQRVV